MPNPFGDYCFQAWRRKYGHDPPWADKVYPLLSKARLLFKGNDEAARLSWDRFLANTNEFYHGHDPGLFLAHITRFATYPKPAPKPLKIEDPDGPTEQRRLIMKAVYEDPSIPENQRRDEYIRRVRERWPE